MTIPRLWVPTPEGRVYRSAGTRDRAVVRGMRTMLDALGPRHAQAWDVLAQVTDGVPLTTLYRLWVESGKHLGRLRALLADVPLERFVDPWRASLTCTPENASRYALHLASFLDAMPSRATVTPSAVAKWLDTLPVSGATKRRYAAAASSFCAWLVLHGHLDANPVREIKKPSAKRRTRWLPVAQCLALANAQPEPYRSLSAFLHATGLDISAALAVTRGQLDLSNGTLLNVRPKTGRQHLVVIASWALPFVEQVAKGKLPNAKLFPTVTRWTASDYHRLACKALGITDYWMRDARHSCAVRMAQAGTPMGQIADQLGHANAQLVTTTYAIYAPNVEDRLRWEREAAKRDTA